MTKLTLAAFVITSIICGFLLELYLNFENYPSVVIFATNLLYIWNPYVSSLSVIICLIAILKLIFNVIALESEIAIQGREVERYTRLLQEYDVANQRVIRLLHEYDIANQQLYNSLWQTRHVAIDLRNMIENLQFQNARLNTEIDNLESEIENQQQQQREIHVVLIWEEDE